MSKNRIKFPVRILLSFGLLFGVITGVFGVGTSFPVLSQSANNPWETPINLSHSGGTTNPLVVIDTHGVIHIIWEDTFKESFIYTRYEGGAWSTPVAVDFPFGTYHPLLVAAGDGLIHAFWTDAENHLFYSHVIEDYFGNAAGWEPPIRLAESALDVDATADELGVIHLTFVRTSQDADHPAGIYYQHSKDGGFIWAPPVVVYQSPYFRGLTREAANVSISSASFEDKVRVYITWDNRPRKQVFLSMSMDGGDTWDTPLEVDKPGNNTRSVTPLNIRVSANEGQVLLLWQVEDQGSTCNQAYQWSRDGGGTWSERQSMGSELLGCSQENQIFNANGGLILLSILHDQLYLSAWNSHQWSDPQPQQPINSFFDPETYDPVNLRCLQGAFLPNQNRLYVVGCDVGKGGDIWLADRLIDSVDDWFPPPPVWSDPILITNNMFSILSPVLVSDSEGRFHAFWSQPDTDSPSIGESSLQPGKSIYDIRWDGEHWSQPVAILASPEGIAEQPAVTVDAQGRLFAVWGNGQSGELFFSWASAARAGNPAEWAKPLSLYSTRIMGSSPDIQVDRSGTIYIAYAVPFNEGRGIYLILSKDGGQTWSEPIQIFDGVAANWESIDHPRIVITGDGKLHVIWMKTTLPSGEGVQGLYYAYSENGGKTWSEKKEMVGKAILWGDIFSSQQSILHFIWQENSSGSLIVWDQQSIDSGLTWSRPEIISSALHASHLASATIDPSGQIHLFQVVEKTKQNFTLQHSIWNGNHWIELESAELGKNKMENIHTLKAAISLTGKLMVIYSGQVMGESGLLQEALFFTQRTLDLPTASLQSQTTPTPLPTVLPTPTVTSTPQPAPTLDLANLGSISTSSNIILLNTKWSALAIGAILALLIVSSAVGYRVLASKFKTR